MSVHDPPLGDKSLLVVHVVDDKVVPDGSAGEKSGVTGVCEIVMEVCELLMRVIVLTLPLPRPESASVDGLTVNTALGVTELEKVAEPVSLAPLTVVVVDTENV
ncbi:hypothetical protein [Legionella sp.]|uniref:hypothetical protein n=1 Tax=Legionella sp. TaxID=459 RepID=UPI003CC2133C